MNGEGPKRPGWPSRSRLPSPGGRMGCRLGPHPTSGSTLETLESSTSAVTGRRDLSDLFVRTAIEILAHLGCHAPLFDDPVPIFTTNDALDLGSNMLETRRDQEVRRLGAHALVFPDRELDGFHTALVGALASPVGKGRVHPFHCSVVRLQLLVALSENAFIPRLSNCTGRVFCHETTGVERVPSIRPNRGACVLRYEGVLREEEVAAGNPAVYVQARAGPAQATMTERHVHAAQVAFPGAAERAEDRVVAGVVESAIIGPDATTDSGGHV